MSRHGSGATPGSETIDSLLAPTKRPRKQVSRACDLCRARRIRCDNGEPCRGCRVRGVECTHRGDDEPRTLPAALRQVDALRRQVRELEAKIETLKLHPATDTNLTPPDSCTSASPPQPQTAISLPSSPTYYTPKPHWKGVYLTVAGSDQPSYFGPASSYYLITRMSGFLRRMLQQPCTDESLQPHGKRMPSGDDAVDVEVPTSIDVAPSSKMGTPASGGGPGAAASGGALTRAQEESVIRLFWEGYHCLMPIIDDADFRRHYNALWEPAGRTTRQNCALVDIILALCLQYGYAFIPKQISKQASNVGDRTMDEATMAGRWYYLRSQALMTANLENPSIRTVQCYLFMIAYLCSASFPNMCHIVEAQAVRTAQVLGLSLEPPADLPAGEQELRRRIWWVLWSLDAKTSVKFGRHLIIDWTQVSVARPADDAETARYHGAMLGGYSSDVTWLSFARQNNLLFMVVTDIHEALFFKCGETIQAKSIQCLYHDPEALEDCAQFLASCLPAMRDWVDNVPAGLRMRRRNGGVPYSIDRSPLAMDVDLLAPTWLQRQAVCLELTYHSVISNLMRCFITFFTYPGTYTPTAERYATMACEHASAFTLIMHQVITETDLLSGWSEYFSVQWNAALTLVAFILAYPIHSATPRARETLDKALAVFTFFGKHFAVSADAACIIRDLLAKADHLRNSGSLGSTPVTMAAAAPTILPRQVSDPSLTATTQTAASSLLMSADGGVVDEDSGERTVYGGDSVSGASAAAVPDDLSWLDPNHQADPGQFDQFMDWAFSVDSFNNYERFFDTSSGP